MTYRGDSTLRRRRSLPAAVSFVSKLNGCTQPSIVMTTGAELWVLKFRNFGNPNALLNEAVGTGLMSQMGLPTPRWSPILVTDEFIDSHPEAWFQRPGITALRPEPGLHFGSRLTLSADGLPTYQVIPTLWHDRVANREDFAGALVADLWTNNCDRRQCLFLSTGHKLHATFIDNNACFGGFKGTARASPRLLMMPSPQLFVEALKESVLSHWKRVVDRISEPPLDQLFEQIPSEWADASAVHHTRAQLTSRHNRLEVMLAEAVAYLRGGAVGVDVSARSTLEPRRTSSWGKQV